MSIICHPSNGVQDWKRGLADPVKHWKAGYSAMACAQSWEAARGLPPEIAALFPDCALQLAISERKTPLPARGPEAQSDVFALIGGASRQIAATIEAKVAESFDDPVGVWLAKGGQNRIDRLSGLCSLIGGTFPPPPDLRYQLFSRTAAAVLEAQAFERPEAAMIVQSFSPDQTWWADFAAFCAYLGVTQVAPGRLYQVTLPAGTVLHLAWVQGDARFLNDLSLTEQDS